MPNDGNFGAISGKIGLIVDGASLSTTNAVYMPVNMPGPTDPNALIKVGYMTECCESDSGSVTGTRDIKTIDISDDYRMRVGIDNLVFHDLFPGTTRNSSVWQYITSTMTAAINNGLQLNNGASLASGAYCQYRTYRHFPVFGTSSLFGQFRILFATAPIANNTCEFGFGLAATNAAPTDGAFFRLVGTSVYAVLNRNGSESTQLIALPNWAPVNTQNRFDIGIDQQNVTFWINNVRVAMLADPALAGTPTNSQELPLFFREMNTGATASAQQMTVNMCGVEIGDLLCQRDWATVMAGLGNMGYQYPTGSVTQGLTAGWVNNTVPTAGTPTNTSAALGTGLGGHFLANISGLTVNNDYIISSFQVPVGTSTQPGKSLYCKGVKISTTNLGAANGATALALTCAIAFGHTAVSLATAESGTTKAPRVIPIDTIAVPAAAAIGAVLNPVTWNFTSPVLVQPGEFIQVIGRFISYLSTTSQQLYFTVTLDTFWA